MASNVVPSVYRFGCPVCTGPLSTEIAIAIVVILFLVKIVSAALYVVFCFGLNS